MSETPRFDPIEEAGRQWRRHWGPPHVAEMMAVTSIMRVQQILLARLNEVLEPDSSDNPGRALADFFRLEDGKVVEHWDVIQDIPKASANNNGMF
jgi:predicted SnoaL-like aldol condensation-catalyzing enzyme